MFVKSMPDAVSHKATEFKVGKAMSRTHSAPAPPPMTMFCGVLRFSHTV